MAEKFILAHDMGTSANKAVLVTMSGQIVGTVQKEYPLYHPAPGFAEQEPSDWWRGVCEATQEVLVKTGVKPEQVAGITFSSQTQSLIPVDEKGNPLMRSITWLDTRSAQIIHEKLWTPPRILGYNIFHLLRFLRITGGSPGHTGKDQIGKMLWLGQHKPEIFNKTYKFLDAKDFIIFKFTGKMVTSADLAYIWWLMDSRKNRNQWHPTLCKLAGISPKQLPEIKSSATQVGELTVSAAKELGLVPGTPVMNGAGDLASAAVGSGALENGELHIRIGTSGGVAGHFTKRKIDLAHYAGCIGSAYPEKYYLGIAHQETAGICLEWLKNNVLYHKELLKKERQVEEIFPIFDQMAEQVTPGANGLIFTPWMYGERCPLDNHYVRSGLFNVGLNHSREHIIRAVLEGIAFNTRWAMETLENLYQPVTQLNIVGGGAKSDVWCQIVADITNRKINQVADPQHSNAKGVALLASLTLGHLSTFLDIKKYIQIKRQFVPNPDNRRLYDGLFREFKNLYFQNKNWYKRMNKYGIK